MMTDTHTQNLKTLIIGLAICVTSGHTVADTVSTCTFMHGWTRTVLSHVLRDSLGLTRLTEKEALKIWGGGNKCPSHILEERLFLASEMNEQTPSVKWELAFPQKLGALARKVNSGLPGDCGALEAHEQDNVRKRGG